MTRWLPGSGYDAFSTMEREVWTNAVEVIAKGDPRAARSRATRRGRRELRRGDYFTARIWFRSAKAIEWLSSPKPPKFMSLH
jgi:hypothetical protein